MALKKEFILAGISAAILWTYFQSVIMFLKKMKFVLIERLRLYCMATIYISFLNLPNPLSRVYNCLISFILAVRRVHCHFIKCIPFSLVYTSIIYT